MFVVNMRCLLTISFLIVNLELSQSVAASSFLLEELKSINYEVDIVKTPVKLAEEHTLGTLNVRSKYGQTYQCLLPQIEETENFEKKEMVIEENVDVKELLKPIQIGSCLLKTKDWWTYEFCYGHYIKQYHIDDGKIIGQVITLGLYESDYDWSNETEEEKFNHVKQRYHSQTYSNGSRCDLTGLPRNAEVRFFCEEDAGDYIYRVDEPGTCSYILTVHTSRLCSHPRLKPLPSTKARLISCSPLLDDEQYALYLQKVNEEMALAENKRNKWLTDQQERLKMMKSWTKSGLDHGENIQNKQFESSNKLKSDGEVTSEPLNAEDSVTNNGLEKKAVSPLPSSPRSINFRTIHNDNEIEKMLLQEYDLEIEKLKSVIPPERFASVKNHIEKQFDSIINEAEEEMGSNMNDASKVATFSKLASTLNTLLERLDKAEKDVARVAQHLRKTAVSGTDSLGQSYSNNGGGDKSDKVDEEKKDKEQGSDDKASVLKKSELQPVTDKLKVIENDQAQSAVLDDDKLHVRIRRLDKKSPDAAGELHEMDLMQRTKLEQAIKEKLEKSGRRIEVKIITAGYYDNEDGKDFHTLSDEETIQFQKMIMALLTGQQEAIQEMERHKKLEENYRFVWNSNEQYQLDDDE